MATTPPNPTNMPPAAPPPGVPPQGAMPPGMQPPPPPKTNTLAWVLGGCGIAVVLLAIIIVVSVRLFVKSHVKVGSNGDVDISVGGASIHAGQPRDMGLPIYPGAEATLNKGVDITAPGQQGGISMAFYNSADAIEKVDAWYRDNLSKDFVRQVAGQNGVTVGNRPFPVENGAIVYMTGNNDNMAMISLTPVVGKTQIAMMRIGSAPKQAQ